MASTFGATSRMKIQELLPYLNSCEGSSGDEARAKAEAAVRDTSEFIEMFERSTGASIPVGDRLPLATHLQKTHVGSDACPSCPYFTVLAPWRSLIATSSLWIAWAKREAEKGDKRAILRAFRTLSTYLSLQAEGFRAGEKVKLVQKSGGKQLTDGNNRVRLLAAMGKRELEVEVIEACGPTSGCS